MLHSDFSSFASMGIKSEDELLDKIVTIDDMKEFKIVGFTDNNTESIYTSKKFIYKYIKQHDTKYIWNGHLFWSRK